MKPTTTLHRKISVIKICAKNNNETGIGFKVRGIGHYHEYHVA